MDYPFVAGIDASGQSSSVRSAGAALDLCGDRLQPGPRNPQTSFVMLRLLLHEDCDIRFNANERQLIFKEHSITGLFIIEWRRPPLRTLISL